MPKKLRVGRAFGWLGKFLVVRVSHVSSKFDQDRLHSVISAPVREAGKFGWIDHAISWADAREIDLIDKLNSRWFIRVLVATVHFKGINSVLMDTMWGT